MSEGLSLADAPFTPTFPRRTQVRRFFVGGLPKGLARVPHPLVGRSGETLLRQRLPTAPARPVVAFADAILDQPGVQPDSLKTNFNEGACATFSARKRASPAGSPGSMVTELHRAPTRATKTTIAGTFTPNTSGFLDVSLAATRSKASERGARASPRRADVSSPPDNSPTISPTGKISSARPTLPASPRPRSDRSHPGRNNNPTGASCSAATQSWTG